MGFALGIDLGTSFSAAAVMRPGGEPRTLALDGVAPAIPTVVMAPDSGEVLVGRSAERRALSDPERVARAAKRRLGDPVPYALGDESWSADDVLAEVLRWVYDKACELEGGAPDTVVLCRPAPWGTYKVEALERAAAAAGLPEVRSVTEPEAAAVHYAAQERVEPGSLVAVYDLGGGTFDATVLRTTTGQQFEVVGDPVGIDDVGGIDFDSILFDHVRHQLGRRWDELEPADPQTRRVAAALRTAIVDAKEALSTDTVATVPVMLAEADDVRITRAELEHLIGPSIDHTVRAFDRALGQAGVEADAVDRILLVGGSSRIPLVGQRLSEAYSKPIAVDAHPKYAVALGAARLAGIGAAPPSAADLPVAPGAAPADASTPTEPSVAGGLDAPPAPGDASTPAASPAAPGTTEPSASTGEETTSVFAPVSPEPPPASTPADASAPAAPPTPAAARSTAIPPGSPIAPGAPPPGGPTPPPAPDLTPPTSSDGPRRGLLAVVVAVVLLAVAGGAFALGQSSNDSDSEADSTTSTELGSATTEDDTSDGTAGTDTTTTTDTATTATTVDGSQGVVTAEGGSLDGFVLESLEVREVFGGFRGTVTLVDTEGGRAPDVCLEVFRGDEKLASMFGGEFEGMPRGEPVEIEVADPGSDFSEFDRFELSLESFCS